MRLALRENRKSEAVKSIVGRNTLPLQDGLWNNMNKKTAICSGFRFLCIVCVFHGFPFYKNSLYHLYEKIIFVF